MERVRTKPKNNGTAKKRKEYEYLAFEAETAEDFRHLSQEYRILYSELMRRMLQNYRKELERNSFYW